MKLLPYLAMMRLLPFKGMIIYADILACYGESIKMSAVMRQKIIEEVEELEKFIAYKLIKIHI